MENFLKKYKRLKFRKKAFIITYFSLMFLLFITGLIGVCVCGIKNIGSPITFFAIMGFVLPIVMWIVYLIATMTGKDSARDKLDEELKESDLTADEVMNLGDELKIDLFGIAAIKRAKELGIDHLPEGCLRDRILPSKEDLKDTVSIEVHGPQH